MCLFPLKSIFAEPQSKAVEYGLSMSCLEVYMEAVYDLLASTAPLSFATGSTMSAAALSGSYASSASLSSGAFGFTGIGGFSRPREALKLRDRNGRCASR